MTILEKVRARENRRIVESTSGYITYEEPLWQPLFVAPHTHNRVVEATYRALGRRDDFIENRVALEVIYGKVDVKSNKALEDAARKEDAASKAA